MGNIQQEPTKTRQCISCRTQLVRDELIRLTKVYDISLGCEKVIVNPDRYQLGRSVYLCKSIPCINTAIKEKKIAKMLRVSIKSVESIIPQLESLIISQSPLKGVPV